MQLPIDVKSLIDEATNIKAARDTNLSVSVYVDEEAPASLVAHVRGAFASTLPTVRMSISYLDGGFVPNPDDDIAIIVAGKSAKVGPAAKVIRAVGVPVMVVTIAPEAVIAAAESIGSEIPEGDVVAPFEKDLEVDDQQEFDQEVAAELNDRIGRWIVAVSQEKRLAFAIAFPFMRRPLANDAVQVTSIQNAGIAVVPFLPGADLPLITLNQAKMALQVSAAYGNEMDKNRLKELAIVVIGAYLCRTLARHLLEFVPGLGLIVRPGIAYGGTSAVGYAMIEYFEGGQNVNGVANVLTRATEEGTKIVSKAREVANDPSSLNIVGKVGEYAPVVKERVDKVVPVVKEKAEEFIPKVVDAATDIISKAVNK